MLSLIFVALQGRSSLKAEPTALGLACGAVLGTIGATIWFSDSRSSLSHWRSSSNRDLQLILERMNLKTSEARLTATRLLRQGASYSGWAVKQARAYDDSLPWFRRKPQRNFLIETPSKIYVIFTGTLDEAQKQPGKILLVTGKMGRSVTRYF